jgi:hypothetical protein
MPSPKPLSLVNWRWRRSWHNSSAANAFGVEAESEAWWKASFAQAAEHQSTIDVRKREPGQDVGSAGQPSSLPNRYLLVSPVREGRPSLLL